MSVCCAPSQHASDVTQLPLKSHQYILYSAVRIRGVFSFVDGLLGGWTVGKIFQIGDHAWKQVEVFQGMYTGIEFPKMDNGGYLINTICQALSFSRRYVIICLFFFLVLRQLENNNLSKAKWLMRSTKIGTRPSDSRTQILSHTTMAGATSVSWQITWGLVSLQILVLQVWGGAQGLLMLLSWDPA